MKFNLQNKSQFYYDIKVFIFALIVSCIFVFIFLFFFKFDLFPDYYGIIARNILQGNGYTIPDSEVPVIFRPPVYPLFLALIFHIFGSFHLPVIIFQVLLNSLTAVIIYELFGRIFNQKTSFVTALLWASYPLANYYIIRELPTTIFIFLFMLSLYVFTNYQKKFDNKNSFYLGILIGTLILTKLFIKGFLLLLPIYIITKPIWISFLKSKNLNRYNKNNTKLISEKIFFKINRNVRPSMLEIRHVVLNFLFFFLGTIIILSPWLIRNYHVTNRLPILGSGGGYTLWFGNNMDFDGLDVDQLSSENQKKIYNQISQIIGNGSAIDFENDEKLYYEAYKNFYRFPKMTLILMFKKFFRLWFTAYSPSMLKYQWLLFVMQASILFPALIGIILSIKRRLNVFPFIFTILYFQLVYTLFTATIRYCVPIMPIILAFAVYGTFEVINYIENKFFSPMKV